MERNFLRNLLGQITTTHYDKIIWEGLISLPNIKEYTMVKLRKGELQYYKGFTPQELDRYAKNFPRNTEYVYFFITKYEYNYVSKEWVKR